MTFSPYPAAIDFCFEFDCGTMINSRVFRLDEHWRSLTVGKVVTFTAMLADKPWGLAFSEVCLATETGRVHPLYAGVQGKISGETIANNIEKAIQDRDTIAQAIVRVTANELVTNRIRELGFTPRALLQGLHRPSTPEIGERALQAARSATVSEVIGLAKIDSQNALPSSYNIDTALVELARRQPEKLSLGQSQALNVIRRSINAMNSAHVLVNGDVGSGKTLVLLLAAASVAHCSKGRVAIMVPSDIVANQIYEQATKRFKFLKPVLLTATSGGTLSAENRMVIGTQSLLHCKSLGELSLLAVDEQHRFSVAQRAQLAGKSTHVLEASATPIPRSLALALFNGWAEAKITGFPVTKSIIGHLLAQEQRERATGILKKHLINHKRVILLYPQVNSTKGNERSVMASAKRLEERFPGKVVCLHGKLKPEQKAQALQEFASGEKPIAVSSTVVEVGVDIPDIGCMLVNDAENFGVAQLHQLRGRLVRNGGNGDFIMMMKKPPTKATSARLEAVRDILDGFALAERDMHLRGFGDVLGDMQSGSSSTLFKLARLEVSDFIKEQRT